MLFGNRARREKQRRRELQCHFGEGRCAHQKRAAA
jgi:hypothetical protein